MNGRELMSTRAEHFTAADKLIKAARAGGKDLAGTEMEQYTHHINEIKRIDGLLDRSERELREIAARIDQEGSGHRPIVTGSAVPSRREQSVSPVSMSLRDAYQHGTSSLYKVTYDDALQKKVSKELAQATLRFYVEGLHGDRVQDPEKWAKEFFAAWDEWIYKLAPLAKAPKWKAENEFRLVHELKGSEFGQIRFRQRETMLARYLPLTTPAWVKDRTPRLPIAKITIGPGNHPAFTRVSVALLLEQMGYSNVPIEITQVTLQTP